MLKIQSKKHLQEKIVSKKCELKIFKKSRFTKIYPLQKAPLVKLTKKLILPSAEMKFQEIVIHSFKNRLFKSEVLKGMQNNL